MSSVGFSFAQTYVQRKAVKDRLKRRAEEEETAKRVEEARSPPSSVTLGFCRMVHPTNFPVPENAGNQGEMSQ